MAHEGSWQDEFVCDANGKPLLDRYGRPVRRRQAPRRSPSERAQRRPSASEPTRFERRPPSNPSGAAGAGGAAGAAAAGWLESSARDAASHPGQSSSGQSYGSSSGQPYGTRSQYSQRPGPERPRQYYAPLPESDRFAARASQYPEYSSSRYGAAAPNAAPYYAPSEAASARGGVRMPKPRAPRRRVGCLGTVKWAVLAVVVLMISMALWVDTQLHRVDALPDQQIANTAGTNWLLVGSDSRSGLSEEDAQRLGTGGEIGSMRTDTIMVLHLPTFGGKSTLLSLPRDSYVNIPGHGMDKINAAFTYGGPQLLTQTVEQSTGLHIDHYAEIGMGGLAGVVDALGGIEICPDQPINDPLANLNVQAGCQPADGPTALGYVRTRSTANGDLDRVQRQREFFSKLVDKTTSAGTLANPLRLLPTIHTVAKSFTVDSGDHVWHLARVAIAMHGGVQTETVPIAGFADYDVGSVVLWDDQAAQELFASMR